MACSKGILHFALICKSFGGLQVLDDITLSVEKGELVGLIGPNGAGKSTLFSITTLIFKPNTGNVCLKGTKITGCGPYKICHRGIVRTFQLIKTSPDMTGLENVMVGAVYGYKHSMKQARKSAWFIQFREVHGR